MDARLALLSAGGKGRHKSSLAWPGALLWMHALPCRHLCLPVHRTHEPVLACGGWAVMPVARSSWEATYVNPRDPAAGCIEHGLPGATSWSASPRTACQEDAGSSMGLDGVWEVQGAARQTAPAAGLGLNVRGCPTPDQPHLKLHECGGRRCLAKMARQQQAHGHQRSSKGRLAWLRFYSFAAHTLTWHLSPPTPCAALRRHLWDCGGALDELRMPAMPCTTHQGATASERGQGGGWVYVPDFCCTVHCLTLLPRPTTTTTAVSTHPPTTTTATHPPPPPQASGCWRATAAP